MPSTFRVRARAAQSESDSGTPVFLTTLRTSAPGTTRNFFCLSARTILAWTAPLWGEADSVDKTAICLAARASGGRAATRVAVTIAVVRRLRTIRPYREGGRDRPTTNTTPLDDRCNGFGPASGGR